MTQNLLVANNRYFPSGGPEQYLFSLLPELPGIGWEPVALSLAASRNLDTPFASRFLDHPVDENFLLYEDRSLSTIEKLRLAGAVIYNPDARKAARQAIRTHDCRAVYGLQIAHYLYPEAVLAAADCNVPSVLRLSDFQLICPSYSMYRDGAPCDLCQRGIWPAMRYKCLKDSVAVTGARMAAMYFHRFMRVTDLVSAFVCPSRFMFDQLVRHGIAPAKLVHIPTPISPRLQTLTPSPLPQQGPAIIVGGLYEPKGAQVAVRSALKNGFELVVAGSTETVLGKLLVREAEGAANITFAGFLQGEQLDALYRRSRCVILPSLWYENAPNVALEAMAHARPVVASNLGSLPELIENGTTGLLFEPGNEQELCDKTQALLTDRTRAQTMGEAGREKVLAEHTMTAHLQALSDLLGRLAR